MSSLKKALHKIRHPSVSGDTSPKDSNDAATSEVSSVTSAPVIGNGTNTSRSNSVRKAKTDVFPENGSPRSSGVFSRGRIGSTKERTHTHSPIRAVKEKLGLVTSDSSDDGTVPLNRDGEKASKNQMRKFEKQADQERRAEAQREKDRELEEKKHQMEEEAEKEETPEQKAMYGVLPINNYSGVEKREPRLLLENIESSMIGKEVVFRARVHSMRKMSAKLAFFLLRQSTRSIQGVLQQHGDVTKYFMYWAERLDVETVVLVRGIVQEPKAKEGKVLGAHVHDFEIMITDMHVEGKVTNALPYTVQEDEVNPKMSTDGSDPRAAVSQRVRMANRVIDLRTNFSQAIFRIQSGLCYGFRSYLDEAGFVEIHTPKLQGGATESGASVFKVDYFGRGAFLAQSPQLAKQMSISADFGKVYEIGAVFRAENSNTHRHLTEYTGLDLEMAIDEHYHEVLRVLDATFKSMFKGIYEKYRHEIDIVKTHFPHEDLIWLDKTPILPFAEAIQMLNETGWRDEHGNPLPLDEDLGTRDEIQLGKVVKEKYGTDYYVLDKFPISARPFYAMPDPTNPLVTNSFDIFLRGQEILSGGQRIHDAEMLLKRLSDANVDPRSMEEYIQGFEWGCPPHGGGGIGLERMLMLLLNLGDIRNASLFHRDPRSFPARPAMVQLRHPEASTMHPPWEGKDRVTAGEDFQPLEKLIANYGDASNTSWLEPRTKIWRDPFTGAAVGYANQDGFAIIVGDPLCHESQYTKTIAGFLKHVKKEEGLKPLWLLVGQPVEEVLADRFNWRTFSVTAGQRLNPANATNLDAEVMRKIRHAEKEGVKAIDIPLGKAVPDEVKEKVDARVKDWLAGRKGKQVHLTNIHPWQDQEHRQYHYTVDKEGTIGALVVFAQLSPEHGFQIKYSMDFPGAPSGSIEFLITHSLKRLAADGVTNCTFGDGAAHHLTPGHNMNSTKVKMLGKAYSAIVNELKLTNKSEFREKLGAKDDPMYICYPAHGLGPMAVKALLSFFEDP
ncbi:aspartyl-tRNA synthetase [Microthyrium microscopicum]|uniref:aspartate--tRNA ligase n=1 Tax=Microthyrium microscopicum TaxID=703497 RepID=A0A6A6UTN2_9PEZI|nr:aspartyl-tRNA synthetase [Microthyrium microscopicum]